MRLRSGFASAAAGFSPRAYADLFDRFAATGGMRGNLLTDQLGITTAEERRLREIYKSLHSIPKPCREKPSLPGSPEFLKWQAEVTAGSPRFGSMPNSRMNDAEPGDATVLHGTP